ncbi:MAG: cupin [Planctomycetia bacterium]|nr:cupin [Planctomycetia bacterium]
MNIRALLGEMSLARFMEDHYLKQPLARCGTAAALCPIGSWSTVEEILAQDGVDALLARRGEMFQGPTPSLDVVRRMRDDGYTLVIRHAERHSPQLRSLAEGFARDFAGPVNVHMYFTPPGQYGFGWHYDAEEVFIVQTEGSKEYLLRKNTVHPWPLVETIPENMGYERELMPVMKCLLRAGDALYIPGGYWHVGQSHEPAASLAIGVMAPAAIDVLDALRERLVQSLLWRQRLPCNGAAATETEDELVAKYRETFAALADDLKRCLVSEELIRAFLRRKPTG